MMDIVYEHCPGLGGLVAATVFVTAIAVVVVVIVGESMIALTTLYDYTGEIMATYAYYGMIPMILMIDSGHGQSHCERSSHRWRSVRNQEQPAYYISFLAVLCKTILK